MPQSSRQSAKTLEPNAGPVRPRAALHTLWRWRVIWRLIPTLFLFHRAAVQRDDGLNFAIEEWDAADQHVVQVLARACNGLVGRAAWRMAVETRPGRIVTLRHGT